VGKTGLGLTLSGQPFTPTESSHGRNVWLIDVEEQHVGDQPERRETYLWDLAGQPGYRLLHQLHLGDVAVGVIVFDARSETDPFAGVRHWARALRQAQRAQRAERAVASKVLVAARVDRGIPAVSDKRVQSALDEYEFDGYHTTSAKEGRGIDALYGEITSRIDWARMPKVSSTGLFDSIKAFLVAERDRERLLVSGEELFHGYGKTQDQESSASREDFETCVDRVAARGLIRRLSFGGLVLLRPEVLDAYAAALVNAARDQPDATGSISEDAVRAAQFHIPNDERIADADVERLLLAATVEEVLLHEVALREHSEEGPYLVFPTQARAEAPALDASDQVWLTVTFEGPVQHVYATLVVRLAHSGLFERDATFRDATTFRWRESVFGVRFSEVHEGQGRLRLFTQESGNGAAQGWFADYVVAHVRRRALPDTVVIDTAVRCGVCGLEITQQTLILARERGRTTIACPVCDERLDVPSTAEEALNDAVIRQIDQSADVERNRSAATATLAGKEQVGEFDVFLAYHSENEVAVTRVAENLRSHGLNPWLDTEQIPPGRWFQDRIEAAINQVRSAAIVIGPEGLGRWQSVELRAFIEECVERRVPVIPVLLPKASMPPGLRFLRQLSWVRFRDSVDEEEAIDRLVWGITEETTRVG
jgi:hypothetical protein